MEMDLIQIRSSSAPDVFEFVLNESMLLRFRISAFESALTSSRFLFQIQLSFDWFRDLSREVWSLHLKSASITAV